MRTVTISCLFLISLAMSAHGFGIVGEGTGRLELDHEHLRTASSLDFDQDELPDLVQEDGNIIRVLDFDGDGARNWR